MRLQPYIQGSEREHAFVLVFMRVSAEAHIRGANGLKTGLVDHSTALLLLRRPLKRAAAQLIFSVQGHSLSIGRNRHLCDTDDLVVTLVRFLYRIGIDLLEGYARSAWIAFV